MVSEDSAGDESDLRRVAENLLRSRPDLADPNKLRLLEDILRKQVTQPSPPGKFMCFVLELGCGVIPAILIGATFPRLPLPILPVIVLVGFLASRYFSLADRPRSRRQ